MTNEEVKAPAAFGSTSSEINESERLLREKREKLPPVAAASASAPGVPAPPLNLPKKKPGASPRKAEPTTDEVKGFSTLYTKVVGMFLPNKSHPTPDEIDLLDNGARGTFRKYPQVFGWFPLFTLLAGMVLFVLNRIGKKAENESRESVVSSHRRDDGNGKVLQNREANSTRKAGIDIRPEPGI